jgi:2-polyprenyl-3-methyl-5-hydroxy-6-metoxy-1,4-benzoquinol methylase
MPVRVDPDNNETRALFALVDFGGQHVLEIGCGSGRLTWRFADRAARVTAIDPDEESIVQARRDLPRTVRDRVTFHHIAFMDFAAARPQAEFDTAILSWSLC